MAKTIDQGFEVLRQNLEITDLQEETVSTRQQNVRSALEKGLDLYDTFLTGSYRRNTMIAPLKKADVDVFAVLDVKYGNYDPKELLNSVKTVLRETYTETPDISPNGQAVTITFTDFKVDVVPGFYRNGGGYLIPNAELGTWISTDPKRHVEIWTAANKAHSNDFVPLLKMLKGWNRSRNVLRSFHLEVLALSVLNNVKITDFPSGVRFVFDKAREKIRVPVPDPAGYSADIAQHVNTTEKMDAIISRLDWAFNTAREAETLASTGSISSAFAKWGEIFKGYFPAYG